MAAADRIDVSTFGGARRFVWGQITCRTPGCVGDDATAAVDPPDEPGELTREDRRWVRRQMAIGREHARVARLLLEEAG